MKLKITIALVGILGLLTELSTHGTAFGAQHAATIHNDVSTPRLALNEKKVTVIAIPGFSFLELPPEQLETLPHIRKLTESGAVGAMNIRTAARSLRDVYSSLGAGEPAAGLPEAQAFAAKEIRLGVHASELRDRYAGSAEGGGRYEAEADSSLLLPELPMLKRQNKNLLYGVGMMGDLLKTYGIRRTVLGSSDLGRGMHADFKQLRRYAPLMLMDSDGVVDNGKLGDEMTAAAVDRPYGVSSDYAQLLHQWNDRKPASFTLIELGDLYRLHADKSHYDPDRWEALKRTVLQEMDAFLGLLVQGRTEGDSLWVFSPEVNGEAAREKAYLSPLIHYEGGSGMLISESTRRDGVVTLQDFASTLLDEFKIPQPAGLAGIPLTVAPGTEVLAELLRDQSSMRMIYRSRPYVLYPFATYEMIVLLGSLLFAVWMKRIGAAGEKSGGYGMIRILLLSLLTAPAVMLVLGWLAAPLTAKAGIPAAIALLVAGFIAGSLSLALLLHKFEETVAMSCLGIGTAAIVTLDSCSGAHAMRYSVLGYDPMIGARYYGIGNEYMGVLIGALVLGVTAALQRRYAVTGAGASRAAGAAAGTAFLLVTAALAAPSLGANAGGALSAAVAFGVACAQCFAGGRWRELRLGRASALLAALLALGVGALWLLNSADSPAAFARESHVGRAFHALREGQFDQIGHLIVRKLRMNVHLLRASAWSKVLITSLFVMAVLVLRPRGRLRVWQHENPYWMYGFSANMIGAIAALLLNDSGIVAAATMIVFVAVPMLLLRLRELAAVTG